MGDFLRVAVLPLLLVGSTAAALAYFVLDRVAPAWRRALFLLLVLATQMPYLLHAVGTVRQVQDYGPPADPPMGIYPGLERFALLTPLAVAGVWLASALCLWVLPALAAAAPLVTGWIYWRLLLPLLYDDAPGFVMIDNVPLVWLFAYSVVGALVVLAGSFRVPRRSVSRPAPLERFSSDHPTDPERP